MHAQSSNSYMLFYRRRSDPSIPAVVSVDQAMVDTADDAMVVEMAAKGEPMQDTDDGLGDDDEIGGESPPANTEAEHKDLGDAMD